MMFGVFQHKQEALDYKLRNPTLPVMYDDPEKGLVHISEEDVKLAMEPKGEA